ncbi:MAG TPA: MBL fold metallo-hydrolase [Thermoanaerobaculia bacterium]|nr:MBL fold metallo-hydrolase [Thermoanaerobaculia bacterium]
MPRPRHLPPATVAPAVLALLAVLAAPLAAQQQDFSQVRIKTTPVAGKVYMLEGAGGNIGVSAGDDGLLIVDDQFAPLADKIKAALEAIHDGELAFVLNTHWHGDHTGGNPVFGLEALIVAHDNVRVRLSTEQTVRGNKVPPLAPEGLPVITFGEAMTIHFNGEGIQLIHAPAGHTDGDSLIYFPTSNVLHMGDHFFNGRFPFVDLASGGTVQGMAKNVAMALEAFPADVKIIPGHGALGTRADLESFHRMLEHSLQTVKAGIDAGKSLEELQQAGLDPEYEDWGSGFIPASFWIQTVYESLQQKKP